MVTPGNRNTHARSAQIWAGTGWVPVKMLAAQIWAFCALMGGTGPLWRIPPGC